MYTRTARVDEVASDGTFSMTLATEGEASDGDILSIKGGQVPDRMTMLLSHWNDPTATAGSITEPRKETRSGLPSIRATGQIELEGEGALADVRRDIALMINKQHIRGVSIRWDEVEGGKQPIRRVNLPSDHPAFVDADKEKSPRKRYGFYWPEWRALEGSIVALGADPKALIERSRNTEGVVRSFWRAMAEDQMLMDSAESDGVSKLVATLGALRCQSAECRELGASTADLLNAVAEVGEADDFDVVTVAERTFFLPKSVADQLRLEREEMRVLDQEPETTEALDQEPTPEEVPGQASPLDLDIGQLRKPLDAAAIGAAMAEVIDEHEARLMRNVQALLDLRTGKVSGR